MFGSVLAKSVELAMHTTNVEGLEMVPKHTYDDQSSIRDCIGTWMKSSAVFTSPSSPKFVLHWLDVAMPSLGLFL